MSSNASHRWQFFRRGGFDQVELKTAEDLRQLHTLDPKLWTALACPTQGLEFDATTLRLIDSNGDGNIRVPEILAAVQFACQRLLDPGVLFGGGPLQLASLRADDDEGRQLLAAAHHVLERLGQREAAALTAADFADMTRLFAADQPNGDGVVPAALAQVHGGEASGPLLASLVADIVATQGAVADRSGEPGVNAETTAAFFAQAAAVLAWHQQAQDAAEAVMPLGDATAAAADAVAAVQAKVDDFFTRCRLAAYDARAAEPLNPAATAYGALAGTTLGAGDAAVAALPLATVAAGAALPLLEGLNPAWAAAIAALRSTAVVPLLGERAELSADDWAALTTRLAAHQAWRAARPAGAVATLERARLQALAGGDAQTQLLAVVAADAASDTSATTIDSLQRLTHLHRDLVTLLRNFVSLADFYDPQQLAVFQAGTLYLDQRSCVLVLRVADAGAHAKMAPFSGCYLVYCQCERAGEAPITIAAALTGGSVDELMVPGRHGVFYDREGRDWAATVTKVVDQPVSVRQAFFAPYRRAGQFIENQIRNFASAREKAADAGLQGGIAATGQAAAAPAPAAPAAPTPPFDIARFAGIFAALGLAVGAIGTALTAALSGLFTLAWWQLPLVLAGVLLAISGPSMLLAVLTLRRRNLGPLLDANGWAVNARARINIPFGSSLTALAELPAGASRSTVDPFAEAPSRWPLVLGLAAVAAAVWGAWRAGWLAGLV
ncbi:hypothetical protein IP87_19520 [beta proteobacterium AAP121]|nr:hypothetical protein IP80_07005 [beta proteobacterium AAP65]KPF94183.1 hypothetical protein IP87_19520 [beta proteobacterium AAP121]